jgi:hypothetical protein
MWEFFHKLKILLAVHEAFCHRELVRTYRIKAVILQVLGAEGC